MSTAEPLRRTPIGDGRVGLPHPVGWAVLALALAVLAVADLVAPDLVALFVPGPSSLAGLFERHESLRTALSVLLGAGVLWALRRCRFSVMVGRPGAVELLPFTTRGVGPADEVAAAFRRELTALSLTAPTPVPGESRPQNFVQAFRSAAGSTSTLWDALPGLLDWIQVSIGYEVAAELEESGADGCRMTVQVRALPAGPPHRTVVSGPDWDAVARRGADVAGAYILPRTRLCRRGLWAAWRRRPLAPELLRAYQDAQACVRERRYEEALEYYYRALTWDPLNTPIRIEVCQVKERLGHYLGALAGYSEVIVTESWNADWRIRRRIAEVFCEPSIRPRRDEHRPRWRGRRNGHECLMIARYRFVCALANGDRVIDEWTRGEPTGINRIRARERSGFRTRLRPWLAARYPDFQRNSHDEHLPADGYGAFQKQTDEGERIDALTLLLRYGAAVEACALARDYAWFRGRRYPGMPVAETALAVLRLWAHLHVLLVTDDGRTPVTAGMHRSLRSRLLDDTDALERELRRTLRCKPATRRGWQDNYNVAAAFAVALLRPPGSRAPRLPRASDDAMARRAVRYLELAVNATSPTSLSDYEDWVAVGDQDLNGLRGTDQYVDFLERVFPAPHRWELRPYDLLTFLTSTHVVSLLRAFAGAMVQHDGERTWAGERDAVRLLHDYSADHADWRTRCRLIHTVRELTDGGAAVAFPRFSDDPGLRSKVAPPAASGTGRWGADRKDDGVDMYYENLTDLRHRSWTFLVDQSSNVGAAMDDVDDQAADQPTGCMTALERMWRGVHDLCDAALHNEPTAVDRLQDEVVSASKKFIEALECDKNKLMSECAVRDSNPEPAG